MTSCWEQCVAPVEKCNLSVTTKTAKWLRNPAGFRLESGSRPFARPQPVSHTASQPLAYSYRFIAMQVDKLENPTTTTARTAITTSTSRNKTQANKAPQPDRYSVRHTDAKILLQIQIQYLGWSDGANKNFKAPHLQLGMSFLIKIDTLRTKCVMNINIIS